MSALPQRASLGDFEVTPELDVQLDGLARRAQRDVEARDALYRALAFKIERFVQRHCRRYHLPGRVVEPEDVAQEAFLVFCDILAHWPGEQSFAGYFFHRFPRRLAHAVVQQEWGSREETIFETLADEFQAPDDALTYVDAGANLRPLDRTVLELRVEYGMTAEEAAVALGVTERTVFRSWARVRHNLSGERYTGCGRSTGEEA